MGGEGGDSTGEGEGEESGGAGEEGSGGEEGFAVDEDIEGGLLTDGAEEGGEEEINSRLECFLHRFTEIARLDDTARVRRPIDVGAFSEKVALVEMEVRVVQSLREQEAKEE